MFVDAVVCTVAVRGVALFFFFINILVAFLPEDSKYVPV